MKKLVNVVTLIVMVSVNTMTPFSYAFADEPVYSQEVVEVQDSSSDETSNEAGNEGNTESDTSTDSSEETPQSNEEFSNNDENIQETEKSDDLSDEDTELQEGKDEDTQDFQLAEQDSAEDTEGQDDVNNNPGSELMTDQDGNDEQNENGVELGLNGEEEDTQDDSDDTLEGQEDEDILPEENEGDTQDSHDVEPQNNENSEGIFDEISEDFQELFDKVKYFFKKVGSYKYIRYHEDDNHIGLITLKDPDTYKTITIMDKNLGAEIAGTSEKSYGYYFQWGNNHGVEEVNSSNKTTTKAVYDDSYINGYDGNGLFIVGDNDYRENGKHYNYLWGTDKKEKTRQASCPAGYHIPTIKEWNELMSIWGKIHTQDTVETEEGNTVSKTRFTANSSKTDITSFKSSAQQCVEGDSECVTEDDFSEIISILSSELKLPLAGGYGKNGKFYDEVGVYWTSISKDGDKAGVFNINAYFSEDNDEELRFKSQGHSIRCFQNTEERDEEAVDNNPGSESMTDQEGNSEQNENGVEPGLNGENDDNMSSGTEGNESEGSLVGSGGDTQDSQQSGVNFDSDSEGQGDEQAKTDSNDSSVLDYLFQEGADDSASSPFPGKGEDNLEQSFTGNEDDADSNPGSESMTDQEGNSEQNENGVEPGLNGENDSEQSEGQEVIKEEKSTLDMLREIIKSFFLNKDEDGYYRGFETIDDITISVEAEEGTFPEGTEVVIKGVPQERLEVIQTSLINDETNNVTEDAQIMAFDISFVYSGAEVQPEKEVSVKFNYQENTDFQGATASEVSVYHIDDETDEGTEVDIINKDENEVEILATEFSIYAIVYGNENPLLTASIAGEDTTRNNFKYRTITISDGTNSYTIMDRNLGSKEPWDGVTWNGNNNVVLDSYGYHYHSSAGGNFCPYGLLGADYDPALGDNCNTSDKNPCPSGWHIPTTSEWNGLINVWRNLSDDKKSTSEDSETKNFVKDIKLPPAGSFDPTINRRGSSNRGSKGYYHASNSVGRDGERGWFRFDATSMNTVYYNSWEDFYVRCFKDSANSIFTVTFDSKGGTDVESEIVTSNSTVIEPTAPTRDGYDFAGWYISEDGGQTLSGTAFDFDTPIIADITLYAKWNKDCGTSVYFEEMDVCATRDSDNIVYYRYDGSNDVISIMSGDTILTMMDKNLGATSNDITSTESYGYHFQWGNNYGFKQLCNGNGSSCNDDITNNHSVNGQTGYENFWPGHPYSNPTFLMGNSDYWKNNLHYDNLWGGSGDSTSNNRGGIDNGDTRQGPCPAGYHVPSMREWETVLQYFAGKVGQSLTVNGDFHYFSNSTNRQKFQEAFLLPMAGYRHFSNASLYYQGSYGYYWSSSPYSVGSNYARYRYLDSSGVFAGSRSNRAYGYSVRCFKDSPDAPVTRILTFHENGGDILGATGTDGQGTLIQKVEDGKKAQIPIGVTKVGATFSHWEDASDDSIFNLSTENITENVTLNAIFECDDGNGYHDDGNGACINTYTVTFVEDTMDDISDPASITVAYGSAYGGLPELQKEGYQFSGWYDGNVLVTSGTIYTYTGDTELIAKWKTATIDFDSNGGNTVDPVTDLIGTVIKLPGITHTGNAAKLLEGWFRDGAFVGTSGTVYTITGDATLRAEWSHTVSFELGGGDCANNACAPQEKLLLQKADIPANDPTREGYQFTGWFTTADGNTPFDFTGTEITGDTVIYAQWDINSYTVTFNSNIGTSIPSQTIEYEGTIDTASIPFLTHTKATFAGWTTDVEGKQDFNLSTQITGDITLYAKWTCNNGYATLQGDGGVDRNCFAYGTLPALTYSGTKYVLMDRNLGATAAWDGNSSYDKNSAVIGYHYQWGNNYGFAPNSTPITGDSQVIRGTADGYSNHTFITTNPWNEDASTSDIWTQGPCPAGWHVPTNEEWKNIYDGIGAGNNGTNMGKLLKMPFASHRIYGLVFVNTNTMGSAGFYLSSSPYSDKEAFCFKFDESHIGPQSYCYRAEGESVRCLMTNPVTLTLNLNGGTGVNEINVTSGNTVTKPADPTKDGATFGGWYSDEGLTQKFSFPVTLNQDQTIYARWIECPAGSTYSELVDSCVQGEVTQDANNIVYYWTDENGNGVISIKDPDGDTILTMMDKNLGASVAGLGSDSYGELYQRGNNAPIKSATAVENERAEYKNYWPGHSFYDATFRYGSSMHDYWQNVSTNNDTHYDNLWGGSGDYEGGTIDTFWGGIKNGSSRQGPCPNGYHVPSQGEWNTLFTYWYNKKYNKNLSYDTLNAAPQGSFEQDFLFPMAGRIDTDGSLKKQGSETYYWSSSPVKNSNSALFLFVYLGGVNTVVNNDRAVGYSIRCFKDSSSDTRIITFNENGGDILGATGTDGQGTLIQKVEDGKLAQLPIGVTKTGAVFSGWADMDSGDTIFDLTGNTITRNLNLKAIFECAEGYIDDGNGGCVQQFTVTFNANRGTIVEPQTVMSGQKATQPTTKFPGYTFGGWFTDDETFQNDFDFTGTAITGDITLYAKWTYSGDFDDLNLYFIKSDGTTGHYTIMDRNMGATSNDISNSASYGYYYKWGNNQGVESADTDYYNLQTGTWSEEDQGPCPTGYHVPSKTQWSAIVNEWMLSKRDLNNEGNLLASDLYLPFTAYWGGDGYQGSRGFYWASSPGTPYINQSYMFNFESSKIYLDEIMGTSYGFSVRCFKNSSSQPLTVDANGGTGAVIAYTGTISNGKFTTLDEPSKAGYKFLGWYDAEENGNKVEKGDNVVPALYARWLDIYTLTLNAGTGVVNLGNGEESIATTGIVEGEDFYVPTAIRTGRNFAGWYEDINSNNKYDEGEERGTSQGYTITNMTGNITLNARWEATITFDGNGGTPDVDSMTGEVGTGITLPGAEREGKVFSGWINSGNVYVGTSGETYNLTLTETLLAQYFDYIIRFTGDGVGIPSMFADAENDIIAITLPTAKKTGYKLEGWYTSSDFSTENRVGSGQEEVDINVENVPAGSMIILYANWEEITEATITFDPGIGSLVNSASGEQVVMKGDTITFPEVTPPSGKKLEGWYTSSNFESGTKVEGNSYVVDGEQTFYAKYRDYIVHFDVNGGKGFDTSFQDQEIVNGSYATRPTPEPYKYGYMFLGWFVDPINGTNRFKFASTAITGDITLYAKWSPFNDIVYCDNTDNTNCITLMDRNMGATATGAGLTQSRNSYGFYYQWGNNYGFYYGNNTATKNKYSAAGYNGYDNPYYGEIFAGDTIQNGTWQSGTHNINLWGGAGDAATGRDDNGYRYLRQGPCPKGYHVPSLSEWHNLFALFLKNNGVTDKTSKNYVWPNYVGGSDNAAYELGSDRDLFVSTFFIPAAGRMYEKSAGSTYMEREDDRAPFWSSSTDGTSLRYGFEVKMKSNEQIVNVGGYKDGSGQGKAVRCFKDKDDFTVTWKNLDDASLSGDNYVIDRDLYVNRSQHPNYSGVEPTKTDAEFTGWYEEGDAQQNLVDLDSVTMDSNKVYIAKFVSTITDYNVEVTVVPSTGGSVEGTGLYYGGDTVILTGIENALSGYQFSGWYDDSDNFITGSNPYIFTADTSAGTGLKAVFELKRYSVTTGSNDENMGTISVDGEPRHGKRLVFRESHNELLYKFIKWEVNGDDYMSGGVIWTGDLVIEELTGDVVVTGHFAAYSGCSLPWGGTTGHGETVTGYRSLGETCPDHCVSQTATCNDGEWDVIDFESLYMYSGCVTNSVDIPADYILDDCPTSGNCSIKTGYIANDHICTTGSTKYKLDSCIDGWHTEDQLTCTGNTQTVLCTPNDQKPANSSDVEIDVTIQWTEGSGWATPAKCEWACNPHYHTGDNGNTCDIDIFSITYHDTNSGYNDEVYTGKYNSSTNNATQPTWTRAGYSLSWDRAKPETYTEDVIIYSVWRIHTGTVRYVYTGDIPENATALPGEATYNYGETLPNSPEVTPVEGYTFEGWEGLPATMPDHNVVVTGTWRIHTGTVRYVYTGDIPENATALPGEATYNYGETLPNSPEVTPVEGYTFEGWEGLPATMPDHNVVVTGTWTINQYTITYVLGNGEADIVYTGDYKSVIPVPVEPTWSGYTFMGWKPEVPLTYPAQNTVVTGQWKAHKIYGPFYTKDGDSFKVAVFTGGDDDGKIDKKTTLAENDSLTEEELISILGGNVENTVAEVVNISELGGNQLFLQVPRAGSYFTKGFCSTEGGCDYYTSSSWNAVTEDIIKTMDTDNVQGPTWSVGATTGEYDKYLELTGGYMVFETDGVEGYIYVPYASYTVTFNGNGGVANTESKTVTYKSKYGELSTVQNRTGYTFTGWYTSETGGDKVTSNTTVTTNEDHTLYAQWKTHTYTVKFHANITNVSGEMADQEFTYNEGLKALTTNAYTKTGHRFLGWSTTQNGEVEYTDGEEVQNLTSEDSGVVDLYAKREKIRYTITYQGIEGATFDSSLTGYTVDFNSKTIQKPSKEGYIFSGWSDLEGDVEGMPQTIPLNNEWFQEHGFKNRTFIANWEIKKYTVRFMDGDSELEELKMESVEHGSMITTPIPVKTGYILEGWYKESSLTNKWTHSDTVTGNIILYAKYDCDTASGYHLDGNECKQKKSVQCSQTGAPSHSDYNIENVDVERDNQSGDWATPAPCEWNCVATYHENEAGTGCVSNYNTGSCDLTELPTNAQEKPGATGYAQIWSGDINKFLPETKDWEYNKEECGYTCVEGSHWDSVKCADNRKNVPCDTGSTPEHATPVVVDVEIEYIEGSGWTDPALCAFECDADYHKNSSGTACEYNIKQENCIAVEVENGHSVVKPVNVTWNTGTNNWNTIPNCTEIECDPDYHENEEGTACRHNDKVEDCDLTTLPEHAVQKAGATTFGQTWYPDQGKFLPETKAWEYDEEECGYLCEFNYTYNTETNKCEPGTRTQSCGGDIPEHATAKEGHGTYQQTWDGTSSWEPTISWTNNGDVCGFTCDPNYHIDGAICTGDIVTITTPDGVITGHYGDSYTIPSNTGTKANETATVTFKYNDGETADVTREVIKSYTASGWTISGSYYADGAEITLTGDIELEARFIGKITPATFPSEPTREHYEFKGWYNGSMKYESYAEMTDITLTAKWEGEEVSIITPDGVITGHYGDSYTIPNNTGTKANESATVTFKYNDGETADVTREVIKSYTASGWTISGSYYADGAEITLTGDIELEARFIGKITPATFPSDPTRDHYEFKGWYNGNTKYESYGEMADITLTAKWEGEEVRITTPDGVITGHYGDSYTLPNNTGSKAEERATVTFKYNNGETADVTREVVKSYTASGWTISGSYYADAAEITLTGDIELEARFIGTITSATFPSDPTRDYYEFKGWYNGNTKYTEYAEMADIILTAKWECAVNYHRDGGVCVRDNKKMVSCDTGSTPEHATPVIIDVEIEYIEGSGWTAPAKCEFICENGYHKNGSGTACEKDEDTPDKSGQRRSGGGGRSHRLSPSESIDQHGSAEEINDDSMDEIDDNMTESEKEVFNAYKWAYNYGITTIDTEKKANPDGYVTRGHLAKMVVNFSVNVLGKEMPVDTPSKCEWGDKDSEWRSSEIKFYAEKACAFELMGIRVKNFKPNKIVSRAEFGTVISRLLWGDTYDELDTDNNLYYTKHLRALQENGFLKNIDNPLSRKELRKRVWVVLRRIELDREKYIKGAK